MNHTQLFELAGDKQRAISYLQSEGLIRKQAECGTCGRDMSLSHQQGRASIFRCPVRCKPKGSMGLLIGSFFEKMKLSPEVILLILFGWANGDSYRKIQLETSRGVSRKGGGKAMSCSTATICKLGKMLSKLIRDHHLTAQERERIGGKGVTVQIDESHFGRKKSHKGREIHERWVLGMIAEGSNDFRTVILADGKRDAHLLTAQICEHVKPGSVLMTDKWAGYCTDTLKKKGYKHKTVNHSDQVHPFVNPNDGTHTQRIEAYWKDMKSKWKHHTIRDIYFDDWVHVYAWRRKCLAEGKPLFESVLSIIRNKFPL